jgi:cytidine deaminase
MRNDTTGLLLEGATKARLHAAVHISGFKVGAAIETGAGRIFTGCNIENISLGLTVCAERVALWKALSEGEREFKRIAVVTDAEVPAPPCGACRQLLWEYCGDVPVLLHSLRGETRTIQLAELLPLPFDRRYFSTGKPD